MILPDFYYNYIHGWLSLAICSYGLVSNSINVFILIRKKFPKNITNFILVLITLSYTTIMLTYIPYSIHFYLINASSYLIKSLTKRDTLFWIFYSIFSIIFSITFHSISLWLCVNLAFYRYVILKKSPDKQKTSCSCLVNYLNRKISVFVTILFCIMYCIPVYLFPSIKKETLLNSTQINTTDFVYMIDESELNRNTHGLILYLSFYFQVIIGKLIPNTLLFLYTYLIKNVVDQLDSVLLIKVTSIKVIIKLNLDFYYFFK